MYRNRYDFTGKCAQEGNSAEYEFKKILNNLGKNFREAERGENIHKHFDVVVFKDGKEVKCEVKSRKYESRKDNQPNDEIIWIEIQNVSGKKGWLHGEADVFAFEQANHFILIAKERLIELVNSKCNLSDIVNVSKNALYKGYQRKGRKDLITLIKTSDIRSVPHQIINKE